MELDILKDIEELVDRRIAEYARRNVNGMTTWGIVTGVGPLRVRQVGDISSTVVRFENPAYTPQIGEKIVLMKVRGQWWPVAPGTGGGTSVVSPSVWRVLAQTGSNVASQAATRSSDTGISLAAAACDGLDDQVQFQSAITGAAFEQALGWSVTPIFLMPGDYVLQADVTIPAGVRVVIISQDDSPADITGYATTLHMDGASFNVEAGGELHLHGVSAISDSVSKNLVNLAVGSLLSVKDARIETSYTIVFADQAVVTFDRADLIGVRNGVDAPLMNIISPQFRMRNCTIDSDIQDHVAHVAGSEVLVQGVRVSLPDADETGFLSAYLCSGVVRDCRQNGGRESVVVAGCQDMEVVNNVARIDGDGLYAPFRAYSCVGSTISGNYAHLKSGLAMPAVVELDSGTDSTIAVNNVGGHLAAVVNVLNDGTNNILDADSGSSSSDFPFDKFTFSSSGAVVVASSGRYPILNGGLYVGVELTVTTAPTSDVTVEVIYGEPTVSESAIQTITLPAGEVQVADGLFFVVSGDGWYRVQVTDAGAGAEDLTVDVRQLVVIS